MCSGCFGDYDEPEDTNGEEPSTAEAYEVINGNGKYYKGTRLEGTVEVLVTPERILEVYSLKIRPGGPSGLAADEKSVIGGVAAKRFGGISAKDYRTLRLLRNGLRKISRHAAKWLTISVLAVVFLDPVMMSLFLR